jgi:peptidoglycan/xylan/chitin deacetylase (PgdA/CDA1 family)
VTATVCLTFDFDAVSPWIHAFEEPTPTNLSRGTFGAHVGVPRILDVLDRAGVPGTFFVTGHTVESFPAACEAIDAAGHPVEHHGWSHTRPSEYDDAPSERADVERGLEALEALTGERPRGYRSPSWDFSPHTLSILRDLGFEYDSSAMGHDALPYYLRDDRDAPPNAPYEPGERTDVLEFPVSWKFDDFPAFAFLSGRGGGQAAEATVFGRWLDAVDWLARRVEDAVFTLTMHPQVTGRVPVVGHLESFVDELVRRPDVDVRTLRSVADEVERGERATFEPYPEE